MGVPRKPVRKLVDIVEAADADPPRAKEVLERDLVILRGNRLVNDVSVADKGRASLPARLAMAIFKGLLRLPMLWRGGWQNVAVARVSEAI